MALSYKLENLDGLDESLQALYKQGEDGFFLDVEGVESSESVQGLKNALQSTKDSVAELRKKELDAVTAANEAERLRLLESGKHEELAANLTDELNGLKAANEQARQKSLNDAKRTAALELASSVGKDSNAITLLSSLFAGDLNYSEAGVLQGKDGETLAQMLDRVKTCGVYDSLIKGSGASGANLHNPGGQGHKKLSDMTGAEEVAFAANHPEEYARMTQ